MAATHPDAGPMILRIVLGTQLRYLRERAGVSREEAAYLIRGSESKISRMELGRVGFKERDVEDLAKRYGVTDKDEIETLVELSKRTNELGWWHRFGDVLPNWFHSFIGLEEATRLLRTYEVQFVPGLLQTEAYARAVIRAGSTTATAEEVEQRVQLRMNRQHVIERQNPPQLWAIIEEAALCRPIGGHAVMHAQLAHLHELAKRPHVTIQVMPLDYGAHAAESGPFTILRFAEAGLPDIVYAEQLTSAVYLDKRADVERYFKVMDLLSVGSHQPPESMATIRRLAERFGDPLPP